MDLEGAKMTDTEQISAEANVSDNGKYFGRRSHLRLPRVSNHLPLLRLQKPRHDQNKLEPFAGVGTRDMKNEQPCPFLRNRQSLMSINSHCQ